jgi:hypothetical protein
MILARRLLPSSLGGVGVAALLFPAAAQAHGIVGKAALPIPVWLFSWAAAIVLVVSFVGLSTLWRSPQLQSERRRWLFEMPQVLAWLASLIGVGLFALVLYSGFAGTQVANANLSVTFIYVVFWVGLPVASVLFGDVFAVLSPWRSCARAIRWVGRRVAPGVFERVALRYPAKLGVWPAVVGLIGFAWLELVYVGHDQPSTLAALSLGYFLAMLTGMALFGVEESSERADGFGVYFSLLSRLSILCADEQGVVYARRPLSGLADMPMRPGAVALVCTVIGTTTFDGFSNGGVWHSIEPHLQSLFSGLGLNQTPAVELVYSVGLVGCIALIAAIYRLGSRACAASAIAMASPVYPARSRTRSRRSASPMWWRTTSRCSSGRGRRSAIWRPTRLATERTCSARARIRSTTRSSPMRPSGTCRSRRSSPATSAGSRSHTTAR